MLKKIILGVAAAVLLVSAVLAFGGVNASALPGALGGSGTRWEQRADCGEGRGTSEAPSTSAMCDGTRQQDGAGLHHGRGRAGIHRHGSACPAGDGTCPYGCR